MTRLTVLPRLLAVSTVLLLSVLNAFDSSADPEHQISLPFIAVPPAVYVVADEASLREAFEAANTADQMPRVELAADIALTAPLPELDNRRAVALFLAGHGHVLDGGGNGPVLSIAPGTAAVIDDLTIRGGAGDCGGGIDNRGHLIVRRSRIIGNQARNGGGICFRHGPGMGSLVIEASDISGNTAEESGGGVYLAVAEGVSCADGCPGVSVAGSTLENNAAAGDGGGIAAYAEAHTRLTLAVSDSTLAGNVAAVGGGGINVYASANGYARLEVSDSTLAGNEAWVGGAVASSTDEGHVVTVLSRSTAANNRAGYAAGVYNKGTWGIEWYNGGHASMTIQNSTLSGNVAAEYGGAILNESVELPFPPRGGRVPPPIGGGYLLVDYSTLTANAATSGGGVWNDGNASFRATIITANDVGYDCGGWVAPFSLGHNLGGDWSCGFDEATDVPKGAADLLPLAMNPPGRTATHALGPASDARDHIPLGGLEGCSAWYANPDQRGVARPQPAGGWCDIGAYEASPVASGD